MTQDPPRLSDDPAAPELARALREAQADVLSPEAVARVQSALTATGLAAAGGASAGGLWGLRAPMVKLLTGATGFRVGLAGLGLVGLGLAGAASMRHTPSPPGSTLASPAQSTATAEAAPMGRGSALPPAGVSASPTLDALPAGAPTVETARATASARPSVSSTSARPTPRPSITPAAVAPPSPREGALLLEARRALGTDPARALTLVRAHEQEFPGSQLGPERARIAAEARRRLEK